MQVCHRGFDVAVTEELFDRVYVRAVIQQMGGKGMPESMYRIVFVPKSCFLQRMPEGVLDRAGTYRRTSFTAIKKKLGRSVLQVIAPKQLQYPRTQQRVPVLTAFTLNYFNAHTGTVNVGNPDIAELRQAHAAAIQQGKDGPMLQIAGYLQGPGNFFGEHDRRERGPFTRINDRRKNQRTGQNALKKEGNTLGDQMAFGVAGAEHFFAIKKVPVDLVGRDLFGRSVRIVLKQQPDFPGVVEQGGPAVMANFQNELQLLQRSYGLRMDGFFP